MTLPRIHRLDPVVANQIAAGEVVERPASVVKELMENSLDAGAQVIHVEIAEGGRTQIRVQDDGVGMVPEDLALSVARHATSKLTQLRDLDESRWFGFRGEALAAVSAVSRLTIASRDRDAAYGHQLVVNYGDAQPVIPVPMSPGTTVTVAELFLQVPARLKSLKSPAAELGAVELVAERLAIGAPAVQVELSSDGRTLFRTPGRKTADEAILAIFGREVHRHLIPVDYQGADGLNVAGFVLPAHRHQGTRKGQSLYVNRRWVTNWILRQAVEEAFKPQLPDRRFPWFWLWVSLDPGDLDPNAHPSKAEVRILRERAVAARLFRAVHDALAAASPAIVFPLRGGDPMPVRQETFDANLPDAPSPARDGASPVLHTEFQSLIPLAQWHAKYIIAQGPGGLYLVDQHAAHERVYFEEFRRRGEDILTSQPLLVPWTHTLNPAEWAVWREAQPLLESLGFLVEGLGGTTVAVRAIPQGFGDGAPDAGLWQAVLDSLLDGAVHDGAHPVSWAENHRYAMAACKAAIKANRPLSTLEMSHLFDQLARADDPRGCPHGRPTVLQLSLEEVDRHFGRRR
ncbi:MAG: DNA mismatch repair endonuclease MutL [Thermaerobacter sp.]|nr:DNA mismatch repair endonuclease MutL [Thermaerobacter sp.]